MGLPLRFKLKLLKGTLHAVKHGLGLGQVGAAEGQLQLFGLVVFKRQLAFLHLLAEVLFTHAEIMIGVLGIAQLAVDGGRGLPCPLLGELFFKQRATAFPHLLEAC